MLLTTLKTQTAWQWANHCGGVNSDYASRVCLDNTGNIFIAGRYFFPVGIFGRDTIPARGIYELFLTKLDPNGNYFWTKPSGGINQDGGAEDIWDMFYDTLSNNLVLSGTMNGSNKNIGGCTVGGNNVIFLSMLDKESECFWAVKQADFGDPYMISVCPDNHGNIYMVGNTRYKSYFNDTLTAHTGGFLAKFKKN